MATVSVLSGNAQAGDTGTFSVTSSGGTLVLDFLDGKATIELQIQDSANSRWIGFEQYSSSEVLDIAPAPKEMRLEVLKSNNRAEVNAVFID